MDAYSENAVTAMAARILLSLRERRLDGWPEWVRRPDAAAAEEEEEVEGIPWPLTGWPKRPRSRPNARAAAAAAAAPAVKGKDAMSTGSPETPLDYGAAAGSGASTSGDDGGRPSTKRRAPGDRGSGGASSGDEGCSSPAKRARVDGGAGPGAGKEELADAVKVAESDLPPSEPCGEPCRASSPGPDADGLFDLNIALDVPWR